jgi:predicted N-formylglutamate amidohydrolase
VRRILPEKFGRIVRVTPGKPPFLFLCEHASPRIPTFLNHLGLPSEARKAHIAWDPGAANVAREMAGLTGSGLIEACISRLVYDLNRPPHAASAMAEKSEIYDIPGNVGLSPEQRLERTEAIYLPFHSKARAHIAAMCASGTPPILITVHSFTPVYHGQKREVEFGVIHDTDDRLARAILTHAPNTLTTRLNEPYSAKDGVVHTLQMLATPCQLPHAMLEIRNDLIATPSLAKEVARALVPVLRRAAESL